MAKGRIADVQPAGREKFRPTSKAGQLERLSAACWKIRDLIFTKVFILMGAVDPILCMVLWTHTTSPHPERNGYANGSAIFAQLTVVRPGIFEARRAYTETWSPEGSTDLTPWRIFKVTH